MNLKQTIILIVTVFILTASLTAYVTRTQFPEYVEVEKTGKIDSTKWVSRAKYKSQRQLLKEIDKEFKKKIEASDRTIASLSKINGELNLEKDRLKSRVDSLIGSSNSSSDSTKLSITSEGISDTTVTTKEVFGEGLFMVTSDIIIQNNNLYNNLYMDQIRKIDLSLTVAMNDEKSEVFTYLKSKDFKELNIETSTALKREKDFPWFWVGLSSGIGLVAILNSVILIN